MDDRPSVPSASIVVQMEEDKINIQQPPPSDDIAKVESKWHPALALDESGSSRLNSFAQPRKPAPAVTTGKGYARPLKPYEKASGGSSKRGKLDTTERRQLRAHLRGARQQDVTRDVGTEELQQDMDSLKRENLSSSTNVQSARSGGKRHPNDTVIDFSGEGLRPESPHTPSTNSDTEISRNGDKVSTATTASQTSEESQRMGKKLRTASGTSTGTMGEETEEVESINEAWDMFETSWKWQIGITEGEKQNGHRFLDRIDETYLGYIPRRNDKRKFLRAYPIIGPVPEARLGCNCPMPMTLSQWSCVVVFLIFFIGLGVGGYFYFDKESVKG